MQNVNDLNGLEMCGGRNENKIYGTIRGIETGK